MLQLMVDGGLLASLLVGGIAVECDQVAFQSCSQRTSP